MLKIVGQADLHADARVQTGT